MNLILIGKNFNVEVSMEISDKELAIEIEDNLTRLMRLNSLKIITAGPNYSVLGPCGQLLFEESDNSPYYAKE